MNDINAQEQSELSPRQIVPAKPHVPRVPRVWSVFLALSGALILGVLASSTYMAIAGLILSDQPLGAKHDAKQLIKVVTENPFVVIPSFAIMGLALLFVTGIATALSPEKYLDRLSLHASSFRGRDYVAAIFLTYGIATISGQLLSLFTDGDSATLKLIQDQMQRSSLGLFVLAAAIIAGLAPVAEELFFRGYLQTRLRKRWGSVVAIIISAAAFGLFHMDPIQSIFAAAMGLALGYVAERSGSIRPAIAGHVFNNLVAVLISRAVQAPEDAPKEGRWIGVGLGVAMALGGFLALQQAPRANTSNEDH
jgi:uncharacterized protein